jgi:hypothetical protein
MMSSVMSMSITGTYPRQRGYVPVYRLAPFRGILFLDGVAGLLRAGGAAARACSGSAAAGVGIAGLLRAFRGTAGAVRVAYGVRISYFLRAFRGTRGTGGAARAIRVANGIGVTHLLRAFRACIFIIHV